MTNETTSTTDTEPRSGAEIGAFLERELGPAHLYHVMDADEHWPHGRVVVCGAVLYGDNDYVQVTVSRKGNRYEISDGDAALWRAALRTGGGDPSATQRFFARGVARAWNVEFADDELRATHVSINQLAVMVQRVLLASWDAERSVWRNPATF